MLLAVERESAVNLAVAGNLIDLLKVPVEALIVVICPCPPLLKGTPRQVAQHLPAPGELVQRELAAQVRVVLQNQPDVVDGCPNSSRLTVQFQLGRPAGILRLLLLSQCAEVCDSGFCPLFGDNLGDLLVRHRQLAHSQIGRQAVRRGLIVGSVVPVSELVHTHEVESVYQFAGAGVGGVMRVEEQPVVVNYRATGRAATEIGIAFA